jgi:penicillin-binding protein 1B
VRRKVTLRRVVVVSLISGSLATFAIATEASIRAHLGDAASRLPTALYARPVAWGGSDESGPPVAIAPLAGSALEIRRPVTLDEVPASLVQAVLAVEDQRFYDHDGLDMRRIGGAFLANVKAGGISQGGSTITQQLAKNLFLSADRTPLRKAREAALAITLELRHDKREILEAYLNEIYLGQDGGRAIHGVGAAARSYFNKDVGRLTLAESALLAGMIHAPNRHTPTRHAEPARARRNLVLQLMAEQGRIPRATATKAAATRVVARVPAGATIDARHFRDAARDALPSRLPARGAAVYTTLDARLQRAAQRAMRRGLDRLRQPGLEGALLALDPRTGDVLAMIGGRDYGRSQFNRAVTAKRQPGSAFKPVVALAALARSGEERPTFTLASMVDDEPISLRTARGPWQPSNYDGEFRGPVSVRQAMEESLNVPFVRIGMAIGPERIVATAQQLGITSPLPAVPSLALGSAEVTLLELVRGYGVLAAGGDLAATRLILGESRGGGDVREIGDRQVRQVVDPAAAFLVTSALQGVVDHGTGAALQERIHVDGIAGKTGTSSDWRDAWFIAYSPSLVVGVWVGHDDGRSVRTTGASAALPIVAEFMADAFAESEAEEFTVPDGVVEGRRPGGENDWGEVCGETEYFLEGTEPAESSCMHFDIPEMDGVEEWRDLLQRRAERFLADMIARQLEQRRGRR